MGGSGRTGLDSGELAFLDYLVFGGNQLVSDLGLGSGSKTSSGALVKRTQFRLRGSWNHELVDLS